MRLLNDNALFNQGLFVFLCVHSRGEGAVFVCWNPSSPRPLPFNSVWDEPNKKQAHVRPRSMKRKQVAGLLTQHPMVRTSDFSVLQNML